MSLFRNPGQRKSLSFNITPVIDIIFLLIVFFVLDFQFFGSDSQNIELPDKCGYAENDAEMPAGTVAVVVSQMGDGELRYSVNNSLANTIDSYKLAERMAGMIDGCFENIPPEDRVIILRIDKDLNFGKAQYALAAASASTATKIKIATLAEKETN
ncbi:MAG: biopolymer transporter ExbD [Sedimentisphaerales bacterium]|nr:biopolymer transporter ExbD [Sedimentisphaerales bacterium]